MALEGFLYWGVVEKMNRASGVPGRYCRRLGMDNYFAAGPGIDYIGAVGTGLILEVGA